jgi:hypothetical protein
MPAFGDALTPEQVSGFVAHIRTFCTDPGWPRGNTNFPRPIVTEKAFPEDELVILPRISRRGGSGGADREWASDLKTVYERRVGRRAMWEVSFPLAVMHADGRSQAGIGDVAIAGKYVLLADDARTGIVSGGLEIVAPTGSERRGLGEGTTVLEPFVAAGTMARDLYLQGQIKLELPWREPWGDRTFVYNAYVGRDRSGTPDTWTFGLELNGENRDVALTPQVRKGLTRTGALAAAVGVQIPVNRRADRGTRWVGYLLWEYLEPVRAAP